MFYWSNKEKSFVKNFGNPRGIKMYEMLEIFNKKYFKINKTHFKAEFSSKNSNKNLINKKIKNSAFSSKSSAKVINNYLTEMLNAQKN